MKKAAIILPTYNEKENIEKIITYLEEKVFPRIKDYEMLIVVADDNSPDGTAKIAESLNKKYKNIRVDSGPKKGLGAAYIRAMSFSIDALKVDVVFEMDADFQHDPDKIPQFLKKIDAGYDFVIGTRYSDGGSIPQNWGIDRKFLSVVGNQFIRFVLGRFYIHDWTGGYRAIKKEVFIKEKERIKKLTGYYFQVGFLLKSVEDGFKVAEVPFAFGERVAGESKIPSGSTIVNTLKFVITQRLIELSSFFKFLVVGGTGFVINFIILKVLSDSFHWDHSLANLVGAAVAIFSNYNLNNIWTFSHQKITGIGIYFWKMLQFYVTSIFGVIFIQTGTIFLGDTFISNNGNFHFLINIKYYYLYFVIGTALLLIWNFFIYSKFIWKKK